MRVLEPALELGGERFELARALRERARQAARDRVDQHHRRQLAAGEDVGADRDRVGREVRHDPLVEALEAGGEQRQLLLRASSSTTSCVELAALRRKRDDSMLGDAAVGGFERGGDDVDAQHHPRAAAVGLVVDLPGAERRRVAVAEEAQVELAAEDGRDGALLGQPREGVRNQCEDVDLHEGLGRLVGLVEPGRDNDSPRLEIDLPHAGLDEREQAVRCRAGGRRSPRPGPR